MLKKQKAILNTAWTARTSWSSRLRQSKKTKAALNGAYATKRRILIGLRARMNGPGFLRLSQYAAHSQAKKGVSGETSYYIASQDYPAEKLLWIVREHWKIESMHWILDAVFSEDECRILSSNGQIALNIFRKSAIAFHKSHVSGLKQKTKPSLKNNMLKSLTSDDRLLKVITSM